MTWIQRLIIKLLGGYKRFISPSLPPSCRFTPTCSEYAIQAVSQWGAICGLGLAIWRVLRCNPLCKGGYDPVPLRHKPNMGGNSN